MHMALLIGFCLLFWSVVPLHAGSINERYRLPPAAQTKVNNAIARSYLLPDSIGSAPGAARIPQSAACGATSIGTLPAGTAAVHLENIVVARGDIITVNRNVLCR